LTGENNPGAGGWLMFGIGEWILILVVILLFFGSRKLPELGRALGLTAKEFKKGLREETEIDVTESSKQAQLRQENKTKKDSE
jgi:sec-independent protein translocase protein TatA